jgi:hypothetical protein
MRNEYFPLPAFTAPSVLVARLPPAPLPAERRLPVADAVGRAGAGFLLRTGIVEAVAMSFLLMVSVVKLDAVYR